MSNDPLRDALSAGLPAQARQPAAPTGGTRATRNNNPGNLEDGPFAKGQPGYKGSDGRFAIFETPEAGRNAQLTKLDSLVQKGYNTPLKLATIWAPPSENNTAAYAKHIADNLGIGANDPIPAGSLTKIAAAQGQIEGYNGPDALAPEYQPDPKDPLRNALAGGNGAPNAALPDQRNVQPDTVQRTSANNVNGSVLAGGEAPQAAGSPAQGQTFGKTLAQGVSDLYTGVGEGWNDLQNGIVGLGTRATDALGLTTGAHDNYNRALGQIEQDNQSAYYTPNGWARATGKFAGNAAALAPLAEVTPLAGLTDATKAGLLAKGIIKYGDYAAQGGLAGGIMSGGNDIAKNVAIGAAGAPVIGAVAEHAALPLLLKGGKMVTEAAGKGADLAKSIMNRVRDSGEMAANEIPAKPAWMDSGDWVTDPKTGVMTNTKTGEHGISVEVTDDSGSLAQASPEQMAAAIGNRASKRGIEGTQDLPATVNDRAQQLMGQGVSDAEAIRQADIEHVGAQPLVATVKRTPEDMRAMFEGAKSNTPEGRELANAIAQNNNALHNHVQTMVEDLGGVPAEGSAAETAARALAKASDDAKAQVNQAYTNARAQDGDQRVSIDGVRELLAKPEFQAPTTAQGRELVNGLNGQIEAMAKANGGRFSPDEIERLNQAANSAYDPMGGGANGMVQQVKDALSESLDQFDKAGPAFKAARVLHRQWAQQYDDPQGIASLIRRDAKGNFVKDDSWRAAENIIGSKNDKAFLQIVRQLKATGNEDALNSLKATVLQRAHEEASKGAADKLGNQTLSGQRWFNELNKIGLPKLKALFGPEGVAKLATIGRAALHMNEAVPGSVNTSNTASAVLDALGKQGQGALGGKSKAAIHIGGQIITAAAHGVAPGAGNIVAGMLTKGITEGADKAANASASRKLGSALTELMNPDNARAAEAMRAMSEAEKQRIRDLSRMLAARSAPAAGADRNRSQ